MAAERDRLTRDGIPSVATITAIGQNVATTALGTWHELVLEVRLPNRDPYHDTPGLCRTLRLGHASESVPSSESSSIQRIVRKS
jgi:hypothetical protein